MNPMFFTIVGIATVCWWFVFDLLERVEGRK